MNRSTENYGDAQYASNWLRFDGTLCMTDNFVSRQSSPIAQKLEPDLHLAKLRKRSSRRAMSQPCNNFELPDEPGEIAQ